MVGILEDRRDRIAEICTRYGVRRARDVRAYLSDIAGSLRGLDVGDVREEKDRF